MLEFLASPRRRRRLLKAGLALAAVAAVTGLVIWAPGDVDPRPGASAEPAAPTVDRARLGGGTDEYAPLPVTAATRRAIDRTVDAFVTTAVVRQDLGAAWELASPEMRAGVSREEWNRGELPVVPYPAESLGTVDWTLGYVDRDAVIVDVMIQPKRGSGERVQVYSVQLRTDEGRWLVDSWVPAATLGAAEAVDAPEQQEGRGLSPLAFDDARLSAWWFLAPAFFLALLVLTPLVLVVRSIRSKRRADRAYREWSAG